MKTKIFKIATYKSGQQFAKPVFESKDINEVKEEFVRMYENTEFDSEGCDFEPEDGESAWIYKHFCEDINHVAVYECEISLNEDEEEEFQPCVNSYMQGMNSNRM
jgi:hypothetical protein